jgi:hypothetical protein
LTDVHWLLWCGIEAEDTQLSDVSKHQSPAPDFGYFLLPSVKRQKESKWVMIGGGGVNDIEFYC